MEEVRSRARLADPAGFDFEGSGITTTIERAEVEDALLSDAPPELFLDVSRPGDDELHTVLVSWDRADLERLLERSAEGRVMLTFDRRELAKAIEEPDVEAQGLREKALVLTVFAAAAAGTAGMAHAQLPVEGSGTPVTAAADRGSFVTDTSSSAQAAASERGDFVTDASSSGVGEAAVPLDPAIQAAVGDAAVPQRGDFVTDASSSGVGEAAVPLDPAIQAAVGDAAVPQRGDFVTDASTSGPGTVAAEARGSDFVTDASTSGPGAVAAEARGGDFVTDASTSGPGTSAAPVGDEGGISISDGATGAAVAGGIALLIAGAGFAAAGQRGRHRPGTA